MLCYHCGVENIRVTSLGESFICYECGDWNESSREGDEDEDDTADENLEWVFEDDR